MVLEYFWYSPVIKDKAKRQLASDPVIKKMPATIQQERLKHPKVGHNCILVETRKRDVVDFLDDFLKIEKHEFDRSRHIEITEDEIHNYDYYYIGLRVLNWGAQVNYEFSRPTCKTDGCPYNARITSPITIKLEAVKGLDLAAIQDIWSFGARFVISEKLKDSFEPIGITGLRYQRCYANYQPINQGELQSSAEGMFIAEITSVLAHRATQIFLRPHYYCREHAIIFRYDGICNRVTSRNRVSQDDFQKIDRVIVKGKEYYYRIPLFCVSRRVLNTLLEARIPDLRPIGLYLRKSFMPVPFD
jgi:hypothetical protein